MNTMFRAGISFFSGLVLLGLVAGCSAPKGPLGGDSPEHLLALTKQYHQSQDVKNMVRLYKTEGVSKQSREALEKRLGKYFEQSLQEASVAELPQAGRDIFNKEINSHGQTIKYNLEIEGQVTAAYAGSRQSSFLYGAESGRYFFAMYVQTTAGQ